MATESGLEFRELAEAVELGVPAKLLSVPGHTSPAGTPGSTFRKRERRRSAA